MKRSLRICSIKNFNPPSENVLVLLFMESTCKGHFKNICPHCEYYCFKVKNQKSALYANLMCLLCNFFAMELSVPVCVAVLSVCTGAKLVPDIGSIQTSLVHFRFTRSSCHGQILAFVMYFESIERVQCQLDAIF